MSVVYGTVFKVENFNDYVVYLGLGMVLWSSISTSIGSAPNLLIQNEIKIKNTNINILFIHLKSGLFNFITLSVFFIVFFALIFFDKSIFINFFISILPILNFLIFMFWCHF